MVTPMILTRSFNNIKYLVVLQLRLSPSFNASDFGKDETVLPYENTWCTNRQ